MLVVGKARASTLSADLRFPSLKDVSVLVLTLVLKVLCRSETQYPICVCKVPSTWLIVRSIVLGEKCTGCGHCRYQEV